MSEVTEKKQRKIRCVVASDKMSKSRVGVVERLVREKVTKKYIKKSTRLMFHDETNQSKAGDLVLIVQTRPISAKKSFTLHSVLEAAKK
ncbi:MAG: 30S ribosomal protein S17 [Bdellovibrionota bacterium]